jgi:hypothetical protein
MAGSGGIQQWCGWGEEEPDMWGAHISDCVREEALRQNAQARRENIFQ